jgi:hypothetical protein
MMEISSSAGQCPLASGTRFVGVAFDTGDETGLCGTVKGIIG